MALTSRSLSLAAGLILLRVASAQNSTNGTATNCSASDQWANGFNATGSISVPGPKPDDSYPDTTWTWSRYLTVDYDQSSNQSDLWQTVGLETSPLQNLSNPSLPFTGCIITITGLDYSTAKETSKDSGNCSTVFGDDCLEEIRQVIQSSASSYSGTPLGSSDSYECSTIFSSITASTQRKGSKCSADLFTESSSSQFLPNNFMGSPDPVCPPTNPGDSNATDGHRAFFSWSPGPVAPDNYTFYDQAVTSYLPVFVAMWLKNTTNDTSGSTITSGNGWADTQIMCIPANETQPGSRNFTEAQNTQKGAAGKMGGWGKGVVGIAGLVALLSL